MRTVLTAWRISRRTNLNTGLVLLLRLPVIGWWAHKALRAQGTQIPRDVQFGRDVILAHSGTGTVIDRETRVGNGVTIFHQVTLGRANPRKERAPNERIVVEDGVTLSAGAKVLCPPGVILTLGTGTVVGANAVLLHSTGPGEVWVGVPARLVSPKP